MITTLFYILATYIVLFLLGYGISFHLIPRGLKTYALWLGSWLVVIVIILTGILLGFAGFSAQKWVPLVFIILISISAFEFFHAKSKYISYSSWDWIISGIIVLVTIFNLSPLFLQHGQPTTLSLGSNDAQAFAIVPDFLMDHSVKDGFEKDAPAAVYTLLPFGYRIGQSIVAVFFMSLFNIQAYQFLTIIQSVLFALALPLVYVLFRLLYKEKSHLEGLVAMVLVGFNVNLLYYLYHNFFGQVLFTGLYLLLIILYLAYDEKLLEKRKSSFFSFNKYDVLSGIAMAAFFYSYHEGVVFVLMPLIITSILRVITKRAPLVFIVSYTKSFFIAVLFAGIAMAHAVRFAIFYRTGDFNAPIGWQPFRAIGSSFINMFEMTGMYSIHSYPQLSAGIVIVVSLFVISLILYGYMNTKHRTFLTGFLATYSFFFIFLSMIRPNFWFYDRAVSYSVPLVIILLIGGIKCALNKKVYLRPYVFTLIIWLVSINAYMLHSRYIKEHLAVEKWMTTLDEIPAEIIRGKKIYSEQVFNPTLPIWKELWAEYFMEPRINLVTSLEYIREGKKIKDGDIILVSKIFKYAPPARIVTIKTLWENQYYALRRACISDECLLNSKHHLQSIDFVEPLFVDSLLLKGWSGPEYGHRWGVGKSTSLRLVNKKAVSSLVFSATTLRAPQKVKVFLDSILIEIVYLDAHWKTYKLPLTIQPGLHFIEFEFSHLYRPADLVGGLDSRELSADFKLIELR